MLGKDRNVATLRLGCSDTDSQRGRHLEDCVIPQDLSKDPLFAYPFKGVISGFFFYLKSGVYKLIYPYLIKWYNINGFHFVFSFRETIQLNTWLLWAGITKTQNPSSNRGIRVTYLHCFCAVL